jgi:hypothetical protein
VADPITETIEIDDLPPEAPDVPEPEYHTLLEVWRAVLKPASMGMANEPITPQWATRIVQTYPQVTFRDTPAVNTMFFMVVNELAQILEEVIASDDQCLKWTAAEDDVAHNSEHYKTVLTDWQVHMLRRELEWSPTEPDAAVMLAALSEAHNMFFGEKGLIAHLESIKFQFTEADQEELSNTLNGARAEFFGKATDE